MVDDRNMTEIDASQSRWQKAAACKGAPSYLFFPDETHDPDFKSDPMFEGLSFRDFCNGCPVKFLCEEYAVLHDSFGIWGDTSDRQRSRRYKKEERWEMRDYKEDAGDYYPLYGHS